MHSILVVDDEPLVRQGIIARIEYLELNPSAVYEASNGKQAVEIVKEFHPAIVLTDIQMPEMTGIELVRTLKPIYPDISFIILTVFAEFDYAEAALHLGVNAYLLKPISNIELKKTLLQVDKKISEQEQIHTALLETDMMRKNLRELNAEQLFHKLLHAPEENRSFIKEAQSSLFQVGDTAFALAIVNIDGNTYTDSYNFSDCDLIKFIVTNIITYLEFPVRRVAFQSFQNVNQLYLVLSHSTKSTLEKYYSSFLANLMFIVSSKFSIYMTIGGSDILPEVSLLSYEHANEAYRQRLLSGNGDFYIYTSDNALSGETIPQKNLNLLMKYIERCDTKNIEIILGEIFSNERMKNFSPNYIRIVWVKIMNVLIQTAGKMFPGAEAELNQSILDMDILDTFHTKEELRDYLYQLILKSLHVNNLEDLSSTNRIRLAINYIQNHFNQDLVLQELAFQYSLSPNYFSSAFKKETGMGLVNYIENLRIEAASDYLLHTEESAADIALKVGYHDSQYFYRVFKKATGMTPLQYRNAHISTNQPYSTGFNIP